ncbi:MAG TPA: LCP family protein [Acidimicrobiia bacterium]|nr:LCP family protein [Acidimicrobiia bacterium]
MSGPSRPAWRAFAARYVIALVVAITLTATGVAAVNREIDDRVSHIERVKVTVATPPPEGANYLLLGSDTREFVNNDIDASAFGDPTQESGKNSDTLMIAHIEPGAQSALVVSFPRDLLVEVPNGNGQLAKINSFFGAGGAQAVVDMLKWNFDIDIHHYVEVDFESFREVVNAIGTVNVFFEHPTRDEFTGLNVTQGPVCKALDGDEALAYVRARHIEELVDGEWQITGQDAPDLHRIERQQAFIRKLLGVAISRSLENPLVAVDIADNGLQYMKLDSGVGRGEVNDLIKAFRTVDVNDPNAVRFETIKTAVNPSKAYGDSLILGDGAQEMIDQLRTFGAQAAPSAVTPSQVKVRVREGVVQVKPENLRTPSVAEELTRNGFVAKTGPRTDKGLFVTEIRYPPAQLAAAKLLLAYAPDAALKADPTLTDRLDLVLGVAFPGVVVPATTAPPSPIAAPASTTPAEVPTTTVPATTVDPLEAACN